MSAVSALGYLGLTGPVAEWKVFGREVLGLQEVIPASSEDEVRFRLDERGWRICVREGSGGLDFIGWELRSEAALDQLTAALDVAGVAWKLNPELAAERDVRTLVQCADPDGNNLEFFLGANVPPESFVSPTGVRFVADDLGLGHLVLMVGDRAASNDFYCRTLGFILSDTLNSPFGEVRFTHVNSRHHSLAFGGPGHIVGLNHFMLEVDELDAVGRAFDVVEGGAAVVTSAIGKHSNDHMLSFYARTPSGFEVEYGYGGRSIDEDHWRPAMYSTASQWGHRRLIPFGE